MIDMEEVMSPIKKGEARRNFSIEMIPKMCSAFRIPLLTPDDAEILMHGYFDFGDHFGIDEETLLSPSYFALWFLIQMAKTRKPLFEFEGRPMDISDVMKMRWEGKND